ncbi:hypothetical protein CC1G_11679 [Coprinopsis cinerea okayama7|uniref:Uncharacterized protein n=1 Tax=Coprinopsis cinerea (strain Okayama-7 / 130 / ATCC MYA-4618 / FGSC 9003) TaxID=240176 RepID=A8P3U3_COPC7|nr:hypothetical protein CC1G_11679 [Coprinopsis cinerea okayama7\|eukprot:XP_001838617.2 hypothetical protein CC1G_11679 [Coprinopsis cinerea okayama7\
MAPPSPQLIQQLDDLHQLILAIPSWTQAEINHNKVQLLKLSKDVATTALKEGYREPDWLGASLDVWFRNRARQYLKNPQSLPLELFQSKGFQETPPLLVKYPPPRSIAKGKGRAVDLPPKKKPHKPAQKTSQLEDDESDDLQDHRPLKRPRATDTSAEPTSSKPSKPLPPKNQQPPPQTSNPQRFTFGGSVYQDDETQGAPRPSVFSTSQFGHQGTRGVFPHRPHPTVVPPTQPSPESITKLVDEQRRHASQLNELSSDTTKLIDEQRRHASQLNELSSDATTLIRYHKEYDQIREQQVDLQKRVSELEEKCSQLESRIQQGTTAKPELDTQGDTQGGLTKASHEGELKWARDNINLLLAAVAGLAGGQVLLQPALQALMAHQPPSQTAPAAQSTPLLNQNLQVSLPTRQNCTAQQPSPQSNPGPQPIPPAQSDVLTNQIAQASTLALRNPHPHNAGSSTPLTINPAQLEPHLGRDHFPPNQPNVSNFPRQQPHLSDNSFHLSHYLSLTPENPTDWNPQDGYPHQNYRLPPPPLDDNSSTPASDM